MKKAYITPLMEIETTNIESAILEGSLEIKGGTGNGGVTKMEGKEREQTESWGNLW